MADIETISSYWDDFEELSVEEMLADPDFLSNAFMELLEGHRAYGLFFRTRTVDANIVDYAEADAEFLNRELEVVPEFGEIPVAEPSGDKEAKVSKILKHAIGLRVSWEQIKDNDRDAVARELRARANTLTRQINREAYDALNKAPLQELAALTPWNQGGDVADNLLDAQELILGAEDDKGRQFEYIPGRLWINPVTANAMLRNSDIQNLYKGNLADANPLFKGLEKTPLIFENIEVIKDYTIPKDVAYMASNIPAGFLAEREPEWASPFLPEDGTDSRGGRTQSFRSNYVHRRGFGVDNPKSVVKLTGLMA